MLQRVRALRNNLALQLGFVVTPVHITDNLRLKAREYVISLRGVEVARWEMHEDYLLAISSEVSPPPMPGIPTREPAFGVSALWIPRGGQEQALAAGYAVVDQTSVLSTHLAELIKLHAYELLTRQEAKRLLDRLADSQPKLVEELTPKVLSLGEVQKVLQQLLREQVSIRDLPTILEALLDTAVITKHPVLLVEAVRQALGRGWCAHCSLTRGTCVWSRLIPASRKSWGEPLVRKFRLPWRLACSLHFCVASWKGCADWPENKWRLPAPCFCVRPLRAFI